MSKYKILVVPSDRTGVGKFRSVDPHLYLQKMYPDEFWVDIDYEPKIDDEKFLKKYDLIHFHRTLHPDYNLSKQFIPKLKKLGIPSIMDVDDHWIPNKEHPAYRLVIEKGVDKAILDNLKVSHYVSTTTPLFADEIKKINKNVFVLPNAVDPNEKQFKNNTEESDRIRIGWLGGSSHLADLQLLGNVFSRLDSIKDKIQVVLCGFDTRGSITEFNNATGEEKTRAIKPHESVWYQYEKLFSNNWSFVDKEHKKFLDKYEFGKEYSNNDTSYRRVWTKPITTYASNYNKFDISLAPLKRHKFNQVKSQLKVIEAGFHKKALIAQNFGPYQIDCINAYQHGGTISDKGNSLLVDEVKNHKQWYQFTKKLVDNPNLITDLGERLYESVQKYHIENVTKERAEIYRQLITKHKL